MQLIAMGSLFSVVVRETFKCLILASTCEGLLTTQITKYKHPAIAEVGVSLTEDLIYKNYGHYINT